MNIQAENIPGVNFIPLHIATKKYPKPVRSAFRLMLDQENRSRLKSDFLYTYDRRPSERSELGSSSFVSSES